MTAIMVGDIVADGATATTVMLAVMLTKATTGPTRVADTTAEKAIVADRDTVAAKASTVEADFTVVEGSTVAVASTAVDVAKGSVSKKNGWQPSAVSRFAILKPKCGS